MMAFTFTKGTFGRITRGSTPVDFEQLSFNPWKVVSWVMGPDGLEMLARASTKADGLWKLGFERRWVQDKLRKGQTFRLALFGGGEVWSNAAEAAENNIELDWREYALQNAPVWATWKGIFAIVQVYYPKIALALEEHWEIIVTTPYQELVARAGYDFLTVNLVGKEDPRYMTPERMINVLKDGASPEASALPGGKWEGDGHCSLAQARGFLFDTIGCGALFAGNGRTATTDGTAGPLEYLVPNVPVKQLPDFRLLEWQVVLE